jgi:hypothetical protein
VSAARIFRNRRVGALVGVCMLVGSWVVLHDAYQKRGVKPPVPLRPFTWWG